MSENTTAQGAAQGAAQAQGGMAALLAGAVAQGAAHKAQGAQAARSNKRAYGVFVTVPEGHAVLVRYDVQTGRELASWWLVAADASWALLMRTKRDALAWLDAQGAGDAKAQAAAAVKLAGGAAKAKAQAEQAAREVAAHARRAAKAQAK